MTHRAVRRSAFTLIELIIVMAIIAVLIGLVLLAMGGVTDAAVRADSANALRSMMRGYISYSGDNRQALMPGYLDPADIGTGPGQMRFNVTDREGDSLTPEDAAPYVWRLLPYLDNEWRTLMVDYGNDAVVARIETELNADTYGPGTIGTQDDIGLGFQPAFGLNSIYLGGDGVHGGTDALEHSPWNTAGNAKIAATRTSEVRNSGDLIVFAPSMQANEALTPEGLERYDVKWGYTELRAPFIYDPEADVFGEAHWVVNLQQAAEEATGPGSFFDAGGGLPIARWSDNRLPTGRFDGSTVSADINLIGPPKDVTANNELKLQTMSFWWPFSTGYRNTQDG